MGPDGETSEIWEETVSGVSITSDASKNILNIARSQLGYKESELNFTVDENGAKSCRAIVPDSQLSLAIGNKGQNVRLAAKLTGWKIDIKPLSQAND